MDLLATRVAGSGQHGVPGGEWQQPEAELLLLCARVQRTPGEDARIAQLAAGAPDWRALVDAASWHGVLPLLHRSIAAACPERAPRPIRDELAQHCRNVERHNLIAALELVRLLRALERAEIRAVPLKGPILAQSVYGGLGRRQFSDLDILVSPAQVAAARRVLAAQGYRPYAYVTADLLTFDRIFRSDYHAVFVRTAGDLAVELHWHLAPRFLAMPLDAEPLRRRLVERTLLSATVADLSAEDLLLLLCVHGSKHAWERLTYVCDVAECLHTHEALDWRYVLARARRLRIERMVGLGLVLARALRGAAVPGWVLEEVARDRAVARLAVQVSRWLAGRRRLGKLWMFELYLFHVRLKSSARDLLLVYPRGIHALLLLLMPVEADYAAMRLPRRLSPLYYLVRPVRILGTRLPRRLSAEWVRRTRRGIARMDMNDGVE